MPSIEGAIASVRNQRERMVRVSPRPANLEAARPPLAGKQREGQAVFDQRKPHVRSVEPAADTSTRSPWRHSAGLACVHRR